jgi:hypothetical protein
MDNHLHVLVRLDPEVAASWSDQEVVRRWGRLFPRRDKARQPLPVSNDWVEWRLKDPAWVVTARARLQSRSWFMKYKLALPDRRSPLAGFVARRNARRFLAGELSCSFLSPPKIHAPRMESPQTRT